MKSKWISLLMLLCFILFGSTLASAGESIWGTIWAGQFTNAGNWHVYTDGTNLKIDIYPINNWELTEVHINAHVLLPPMTGSGNPKVGHFMWGDEFDPTTDPYSWEIPFSGTGATTGQNIYVAIHVVVVKTNESGEIIEEETGWGGPCGTEEPVWDPTTDPLPPGYIAWGKRWGYYFMYML